MAIQVNGTTVINNSRQLSNIASVDSATATAIGNAGVGGATKLITADAALTGGSTYSFSLTSDYNAYFLAIQDIRHNSSVQQAIYGRFTNSSGSAITSGYHTSKDIGNTNSPQSNANQFKLADDMYSIPTYDSRIHLYIWIYNSQLSTQQTFITYHGHEVWFGNALRQGIHGEGMQRVAGEHNSFYIFPEASSWASGGRYSMWGVDL